MRSEVTIHHVGYKVVGDGFLPFTVYSIVRPTRQMEPRDDGTATLGPQINP